MLPADSREAPPALAFTGVSAGYGSSSVVEEVSLEVPPAGAVALLGPNGAGKTTLLRVASGLLRPASGSVLMGGVDVTSHSAEARVRQGLCEIPEGRGIFPSLTVQENLRLLGRAGHEAEDLASATELFPVLGQRLKQTAGTLSGGEQQILAMTRAYLTNPKVVMVDEASLGLAPLVVSRIFEVLAALLARGAALLIVEQYVARALALADRVYLLNRGRIVFAGTSEAVADRDLTSLYLAASAPDAKCGCSYRETPVPRSTGRA